MKVIAYLNLMKQNIHRKECENCNSKNWDSIELFPKQSSKLDSLDSLDNYLDLIRYHAICGSCKSIRLFKIDELDYTKIFRKLINLED